MVVSVCAFKMEAAGRKRAHGDKWNKFFHGVSVDWAANKVAHYSVKNFYFPLIVVPHSLIRRWLALLYYLYYLRLAALSKAVWNDYIEAA